MKVKALILFFLFIGGLSALSGCQWQENYVTQYGFTNEKSAQANLESTRDGFKLQLPFADFSCQPVSFKLNLTRQGNNLTLILTGTETPNRCAQKFFANVSGMKTGSYWLKVIYQKGAEKQEVFYQPLEVK
jgi:hypothetical protein